MWCRLHYVCPGPRHHADFVRGTFFRNVILTLQSVVRADRISRFPDPERSQRLQWLTAPNRRYP